jgi:phage host-nuclease inhibitor protein Gam
MVHDLIPSSAPAGPTSPAGDFSLEVCERALSTLLQATLRYESLVAQRDTEIAKIQKRYEGRLADNCALIDGLECQIKQFYKDNRAVLETDGRKSVQLASGMIGMRAATNPALVPLNEKWSWKKIEAAVRKLGTKYFHKPKPALNKVKIKAELDAAGLAKCGLKLDDTDTCYIELNRLAERQEMAA